jgi:hypothetical protein
MELHLPEFKKVSRCMPCAPVPVAWWWSWLAMMSLVGFVISVHRPTAGAMIGFA